MKINFTKSKRRKQCFTILFLILTAFISQAQVRWHANADKSGAKETDYFRRFDTAQSRTDGDCKVTSGTPSASESIVEDSKYGKVWRVRKPKTRQRAELARTEGDVTNFKHGEGSTYYYGWRWKISVKDGNVSSTENVTVWQWKTDGSDGGAQNYPLNMEYSGGKLKLEAWGPCMRNGRIASKWSDCGPGIARRRTTLASVSVPEDTWVDIVLRIKKDDDPTKGYVEFWFNGVQQTLGNANSDEYEVKLSDSKKRAYHRTSDGNINSDHNVYPKWGSYNRFACKYDITTYYDEMRVASSLADASPETHDPGSSSSSSIEGSWYKLKNVSTNRYMDGNNEDVGTSTSSSGNDKQFRFVKHGSYYNIDIRKSSGTGTGIMRTVASQNRLKLTNLSPRNDSDKRYDIRQLSDGSYSIKATNANKYLQNNTSNTVTLTVNGPSGNNRARWELIRVGSAKTENEKIASEPKTKASVSIYPNPVSHQFNIALKGMDKANITISNILGKVVYTTSTTNNEITLSKSNGFSAGVYILNVTDTTGQSYIKKFVVQ